MHVCVFLYVPVFNISDLVSSATSSSTTACAPGGHDRQANHPTSAAATLAPTAAAATAAATATAEEVLV